MSGAVFERRRDIPLKRDASGRYLPWLIAVMVYLAALALVSAMAMTKVAGQWQSSLTGQLTIQVPAAPLADAETEEDNTGNEAAVNRVMDILQATEGVTAAEPMPLAEINQLLEPWLGVSDASASLPLPRLIAVTIDTEGRFDLGALRQRLRQSVPGTTVDDHQQWLGSLLNLAGLVRLVALFVVVLVGLSAVVMVVFVTRMGLAVHRQIIELLHLIGAHDAYVARQFQWHALGLGLRGGLIGLACAGLTLFAADHFISQLEETLLPTLSLQPWEWALLGLLPLIAATVTMLTARITVLHSLSRML
ncbi:MAG: hypothetical protein AAF530_06770 [Pseudomonadota bacterium]